MRRSAYVFAPVLAATAATVLSGCREERVCQPSVACSEAAAQTRYGGFGESFNGDTVAGILVAAGVVAFARFSGIGG